MAKTELAKRDPRDIQLAGCTLTQTGIRFDKPLSLDEWIGVGQFLERANGAIQWWLGDWYAYGEGRKEKWGDKYEQGLSQFNLSYSSLRNYCWVSNAVQLSTRVDNLPWAHHREVARLDSEAQEEILAEAAPLPGKEEPRLTCREVAGIVRERVVASLREENPLPSGKYRILYADPPWKYADQRMGTVAGGGAVAHYDCLSIDELCELQDARGKTVRQRTDGNDVLFMWVTSPLLDESFKVIEAWGFKYKSSFVWDKERTFNGHYNAVRHELLLVCTKGSCTPDMEGLYDSVVAITRDAHSKKPEEFREMIDAMYPEGSRVELFARKVAADGWDTWGAESS